MLWIRGTPHPVVHTPPTQTAPLASNNRIRGGTIAGIASAVSAVTIFAATAGGEKDGDSTVIRRERFIVGHHSDGGEGGGAHL